jgi:hypothetical protein
MTRFRNSLAALLWAVGLAASIAWADEKADLEKETTQGGN